MSEPETSDRLRRLAEAADRLLRLAEAADQLLSLVAEWDTSGWTVAETAKYLGLSEAHVRRLAGQGMLSGRKLAGLAWRLDPESVRAYGAEEHRPGPKPKGRPGGRPKP